MPLKKILFRPGVNRENTRYASESIGSVNTGTQSVGGWYESDKVRFRAGTPEKIGGWSPLSTYTFLGICRSLWGWVTNVGVKLLGVGTNIKFYVSSGGNYYDITPITTTQTLTNPFATDTATNTGTTTTVTVTDAGGGYAVGDYVTFNPSVTVGGVTIFGDYEVKSLPTTNKYTITATGTATSTTTGGGTVYAMYELPTGAAISIPTTGWGAGGWGLGTWGNGTSSTVLMRLWSQSNFGEDLLFGYYHGAMYYWNASIGLTAPTVTVTVASPAVLSASISLSNGDAIVLNTTGALPTGLTPGTIYYVVNHSGITFNLATSYGGAAINTSGTQSGDHSISTRAVPVSSLGGASGVPTVQNFVFVSDINRFAFAFGANDYGSSVQDPMLIRWADQETVTDWIPAATNQAGSIRLSHGSEIVTAIQTRQEIVVLTDSSVYSLQYSGPPAVWGAQLLGDNISIVGMNGAAQAASVVYWMGTDKFYKYDGRVQTLRCDLRQYIYGDINLNQSAQFFAGTNEGFNEVWWFYCSTTGPDGTGTADVPNTTLDRYVVYNYLEDIWYYGTIGRTAWLDSGTEDYPIGATYSNNLVYHESGNDDNVTGVPVAIDSFISSSEFDIEDGHNFGFVWRVLPDLTFRGSTGSETPQVTMTLIPLQNSGSGYNDPQSEGAQSYATISRIAKVPVEEFTGQVYIRVRGRQMVFKVEGNQLGLMWQLGAPRIDIRPDGRRGNT
jgi:hypothetical protein